MLTNLKCRQGISAMGKSEPCITVGNVANFLCCRSVFVDEAHIRSTTGHLQMQEREKEEENGIRLWNRNAAKTVSQSKAPSSFNALTTPTSKIERSIARK